MKVTAELDFNRVTQTQDTYDPDSKVVRSTQTREESSHDGRRTTRASRSATSCPTRPARAARRRARRISPRRARRRSTTRSPRRPRRRSIDGGRIKRVSVAVLVDGIYSKDTSGGIAYAPRAKEDIDRIAALVRSAMGFDQQRGDQIEVVNLRFAEGPALIEAGADQPWWASYVVLHQGRHHADDRARHPRHPVDARSSLRRPAAGAPRGVARCRAQREPAASSRCRRGAMLAAADGRAGAAAQARHAASRGQSDPADAGGGAG